MFCNKMYCKYIWLYFFFIILVIQHWKVSKCIFVRTRYKLSHHPEDMYKPTNTRSRSLYSTLFQCVAAFGLFQESAFTAVLLLPGTVRGLEKIQHDATYTRYSRKVLVECVGSRPQTLMFLSQFSIMRKSAYCKRAKHRNEIHELTVAIFIPKKIRWLLLQNILIHRKGIHK